MIAKGLEGKIAVIDTERGSASLYSDITDFDTLELNPPFSPERYIEALKAAEKAGFDTVIIDSISHEWTGSGGCLELNDLIAQTRFKGNTWSAWSVTTPRHRAFIDAILQSPLHVIATMRSKTETVQADGGRVKKLGMKAETRDGTDYEFTIQLDCMHETHIAVATKDRTGLFKEPHVISVETGKRLKDWLHFGAEPEPFVAPITVVETINNEDPMSLVAQLIELAGQKDNQGVLQTWDKIKTDKNMAKLVWNELKIYDDEFEFINNVLRKK